MTDTPSMHPDQASLFDADHTEARATDPDTSHEAAKLHPLKRNSRRRAMAQAIADAHPFPLNWDSAAEAAGIPAKSSPWRLLTDLRRQGVIEAIGTTMTSSNAKATAYIITPEGWKALNDDSDT